MQDVIVHADDILWKFYKKFYVLDGKEIESPKNLCRYVQTAIAGFFLWLHKEVRLLYLWLGFAAVVALTFWSGHFFQGTHLAFIKLVVSVLVLVMTLSLIFLMVTSMLRFALWMPERAEWMIKPLVLAGAALFVGFLASDWRNTIPAVLIGLLIFATMAVAMVSVVAGIHFLMDRFGKTEAPFLRKTRKTTSTFGAFLLAKKQRICPLVTVSDDLLQSSSN